MKKLKIILLITFTVSVFCACSSKVELPDKVPVPIKKLINKDYNNLRFVREYEYYDKEVYFFQYRYEKEGYNWNLIRLFDKHGSLIVQNINHFDIVISTFMNTPFDEICPDFYVKAKLIRQIYPYFN